MHPTGLYHNEISPYKAIFPYPDKSIDVYKTDKNEQDILVNALPHQKYILQYYSPYHKRFLDA